MLDTADTARRIQALKEAVRGTRLPAAGPMRPDDLAAALAKAGVPAALLDGEGSERHAAAADLLARQSAPGLAPRRFADALVELGYTPARAERLVAHRGAKLRAEMAGVFRRARTAGLSPDPYLPCCLILEDGVRDDLAADARNRVVADFHRLAA